MILKGYSIFDKQTGEYARPFFVEHEILAKRNFERLCNDPETNLYSYPQDFCLYFVSEYDTNTGRFSGESEIVINGTDIQVARVRERKQKLIGGNQNA